LTLAALGDLAGFGPIPLLAAARLRQTLRHFRGDGGGGFLGPGVERGRVARSVLAQIRHGTPQALYQHIKDFAEFGKLRFLAEYLDEAGEVVVFGDAGDGGDAE
jgi:hypothetical protein